jgi:hypothetical protein
MGVTDARFESWGVEESPISIEYSLVVIEEIRQEVAQGLRRFSRGGLEVGGVLYGTREDRKVRVLAMRSIECEHKEGPSFLLSQPDRDRLEQQLREDRNDPNLQGMVCVGWFVAHTRGELALTDSDQEIFRAYFSDPGQVTLVVLPTRGSAMRAGFFVWEDDGSLQAGSSYREFDFPDRLAALLDRPRGERSEPQRSGYRSGNVPIPIASRREPPPPPAEAAPATNPGYVPAPPRGNRRWPWVLAIAGVLIAVVAVLGFRNYFAPLPPEPMALVLVEDAGQLQVSWNPGSRPVGKAVRGYLEIVDGGESYTAPLDRPLLDAGKYVYVRRTGEVEVRLVMEDLDGTLTTEATKFLGRPPEAPQSEELDALRTERDALQAEMEGLREQNAGQAARIRELQRTLTILETRLGITQ